MSRSRWHILREGEALTLARTLPPRFDVVAETVVPLVRPLRLAHQVRQDIWRALRSVRGFSPVVRVEVRGDAMVVRAGGRAAAPVAAALTQRIADVLENETNRRRWLRHARMLAC
ncbi:MAG: hypothetical protein AAF367_20480 [Pseudomonadota bacterium]